MQSLLLVKPDFSSFEPSEVEQLFHSDHHFRDPRVDSSSGELSECDYVEGGNSTTIYLSDDRECLSIDDTGEAALKALLIVQKALGLPVRAFDSSYTFDLTFSDISSVEELEVAIDSARTS